MAEYLKNPAKRIMGEIQRIAGYDPGKTLISIKTNEKLLSEGEKQLEELKQLMTSEGKRQGKSTKIGAIAGAGIGIAAAPFTVGISLVAVPLGYKIGQWIGRKRQSVDLEEIKKDLDETTKEVDELKTSLAGVKRDNALLSKVEGIYEKQPNHASDVFTIEDYMGLDLAQKSDYEEIVQRADKVLTKVNTIDGFKSAYKEISGHEIPIAQSIQLLLSQLGSDDPKVQSLALSRLYPLEHSKGLDQHSKVEYKRYLHSSHPEVQSTALKMMVTAPELRPDEKEFVKILERFLASQNEILIEIALYAIYNTNYKSGNINYQLRKISDISSRLPEKLRIICSDVFQKRLDQKNARLLDSKSSTDYILETIVGNDHLRKSLRSILYTYIGSINDIGIHGPFVFIYLFGPPGTGKTTLISRIQEEIHQDSYGLIRITMPEIKTLDHLVKQLQDASPLQGKTIFFDEFQALDNIEPVEEQNKVIEFLKLVFATEEDNKAIVVNEKIKSSYRLDLKGVIIAVATNINLPDLKCMEGGKVGEALMSRIFNISIPLLMKTDLKEDIDEFVKKFLIHKFYKFAITRHFEDNVSITDKAKEQIVEDLKNETQHLPKVTGRDLTMKMILTINHAITEYEQENNRMLERDNSGKVVQELTIDVDNENCYKVLLNENIVDNLQFR